MTIQLIIPGRDEAVEPFRARLRGAVATPAATDLLQDVEVLYAFDLSQPSRALAKSADMPPRVVEVEDDDILEIEVEGGLTLWTSAKRYQERVALWRPEADTDDGLEVTGLPGPSIADRDVKDWFTGALRVLRLKSKVLAKQIEDPKNWKECVADLALEKVEKAGAWATAKLLMYLIERRLTPAPGLYQWSSVAADAPLDLSVGRSLEASDLPKNKHMLVFIHGTASRTLSSFGAFCDSAARQEWRLLRETFGEHIYVFEHRTMSESPIDNALALAERLPEGAQVSFVTHSRGGQVGDLLCLGATDLDDARIDRFKRASPDFDEADRHDRKQLKCLRDQLRLKRLQVMRVVRVACPARGTLLASDNIDEFLSLLTNLVGYIPGLGQSPVYDVIKRVTLQVAKDRTDPALIPGIEAMMPGSPLVSLLNAAKVETGELGVIAGDIEGGNWLKRIAVFISDRFVYGNCDNDLVVNTDSMFYGVQRKHEYYIFDQGSDVSHFNYFQNSRTRIRLAQWLQTPAGQPPQEFLTFQREEQVAPVPMQRGQLSRGDIKRPVLFVLPDFMGSSIERKGATLWLDWSDLMAGGLGKIKDVDDNSDVATSLLGEYYGSLCQYLADSHEVFTFSYDWRKSIREAAVVLADEVEKGLKNTSQPLRFVAHGMGGLVVRRFIADHADLWDKICARPGSRFLMLGTPNAGTYFMVETLLGATSTVRQLALLDLQHDVQQVVDSISDFPGALELLPRQQDDTSEFDWFTKKAWQALKKANGDCAAVPEAKLLAEARKATALPNDIPHADCVVYVAGSAASTTCGTEIDKRGRLVLSSTVEGDGRVTHASGKLPGVATWYMPAEHGELPAHKPAFPALLELLEHGKTMGLSTTPPDQMSIQIMKLPYLPQPVLYPTRSELSAGFMGKPVRAYRRRESVCLKAWVAHADLRYATFPVMVGHYLGDTIVAAESYLDRKLDNALSDRYQLGIYPGKAGTTAIVNRPASELETRQGIPRGAIVIGLGQMGELGHGTLTQAVRDGALQYALQTYHSTYQVANTTETYDIGLSALLIGANSASTLTVEDSVSALLRAVTQANAELERARIPVRFNQLEIIELFGDVATQAAHAARKLAPAIAQSLDTRIDVKPELVIGRNGRIRRSQMPPPGQWRRWSVTAESQPQPTTRFSALPKAMVEHFKSSLSDVSQLDEATWRAVLDCAFTDNSRLEAPNLSLRYVTIADRARTEDSIQQRQPELIDKFVQRMIQDTQFRVGAARTLCELLLPNQLKDSIRQLSRLVIELDAETANYPWELMVDEGEPLCVKLGFVRQLRTSKYRAQIRAASSSWAYVVGDPVTSDALPSLPGARAEARLVADLLGNRGYTVEYNPERPGAIDVLNRLYARPYRVLHLAGHGYFEESKAADRPARSGMVLQDGMFLTAVEIAQMRHVPDLVFLNCCHLAKMGPDFNTTPSVAYNKLAASLSRELIDMGVRVVIAAGWAVRDDAALGFAKLFYSAMLNGETFGNALQNARRGIWEEFRDCNTWGAYQAYGDPDFRLNVSQAFSSVKDLPFVAVDEVLYELGTLRIRSQDVPRIYSAESEHQWKEALLEELTELKKKCPAVWQTKGAVLYRFARVYAELGEFNSAIDCYRQALETDGEESGVDIAAAEQLANLQARLGQKQNNPESIIAAIESLKHLLALGKNRERLALLGSAYKCLAQVKTDRNGITESLTQAAAYYREATQSGVERGQFDPYHGVNWVILEALLGRKFPESETWLARCEATAIERYAADHKLWDATALPDADVARRLLQGRLKFDCVNTVIASYREAFSTAKATLREQDSVVGQLKFIRKILERLDGDGVTIKTIRAILKGLTGEDEPHSVPVKETRKRPSGARERRSVEVD